MKITKEKAVEIAIQEGKVYKAKLAGTMLLIIYRDKNACFYKEISFIFESWK